MPGFPDVHFIVCPVHQSLYDACACGPARGGNGCANGDRDNGAHGCADYDFYGCANSRSDLDGYTCSELGYEGVEVHVKTPQEYARSGVDAALRLDLLELRLGLAHAAELLVALVERDLQVVEVGERRVDAAGDDEFAWRMDAAIGARHPAAEPNPQVIDLSFKPKVILELKRAPTSGGCG